MEEHFGSPAVSQVLLVDRLAAEKLPFFNGPAFPEGLGSLEVLPAHLGLGEGLQELGLSPGEFG